MSPDSTLFRSIIKPLFTALLAATLLSGCGGTKVYNTSKTVVYRDNIYNVSNVQQIGRKITGKISETETVDLTRAEKKEVENLLDQHGSMFVTMAFQFDDQNMPYRANRVEKYRDYSDMLKSFNRAGEDIADLLKDKKDTQLELR